MRKWLLCAVLLVAGVACGAQTSNPAEAGMISPSQPVPVGRAPGMKWQMVKDTPGEKVYAVVFYKGDEALSGLTDFALANNVKDAHFTGIGAISSATLAALDVSKKSYKRIPVASQAEVLSLMGDIATFNGKPVVHMHATIGRPDGSVTGGHVFELNANPTLEVFVTAYPAALGKRPDDASGMKVIDPKP
jgi:predicted DNA-binding protein with PD1-like motif